MLQMYKSQAVPCVEFYHAEKRHFFRTVNTDEIADLIGGKHAGWQRTGNDFIVVKPQASVAWSVPVARFFSEKLDTHFFTTNEQERIKLQGMGDIWTLETLEAFRVFDQDIGGVASVTRWWNEKDNHRYVPATYPLPIEWNPLEPANEWRTEGNVFYIPLVNALTDDSTPSQPPTTDPNPPGTEPFTYAEPTEILSARELIWGASRYIGPLYSKSINVFTFVAEKDGAVTLDCGEYQSPAVTRQCAINLTPGDMSNGKGSEGNLTSVTLFVRKGTRYYFNVKTWSSDIGPSAVFEVQTVFVDAAWPN